MQPEQYEKRFHNLDVSLGDANGRAATVQVNICKYLNASSMTEEQRTEKRVLARLARGNQEVPRLNYQIARSFNGKGSLQQLRNTLRFAWQNNRQGRHGGLQQYADTFLGMDCSGFVNGYFQLRRSSFQERTIGSYYQSGQRQQRVEFSDFRRRDVLVWCGPNGELNARGTGRARHIAVVDALIRLQSEDAWKAKIIEATGTIGIINSVYVFHKTDEPGVFRVFRTAKGVTNHVRVVPVL